MSDTEYPIDVPGGRRWQRPVPLVGDVTTAAERAAAPWGWALPAGERRAVRHAIDARRDVRRFRPDDVDDALLEELLLAAHHAPSVGHSQPWRFVVVRDEQTRARAAWLADAARLRQAATMDEASGRQLLELRLEGIREAPLGVVVCCDRRVDAGGVLGRATFVDADMWSCACAIQNLWLVARGHGLGVGWVTLFEPQDLLGLIDAPAGVETLGWLCIGYPDEREPAPGLQRRGWSARTPLDSVVMRDRWDAAVAAPRSRSGVTAPSTSATVAARDDTDELLTPPMSLGVLDRAIDRVVACSGLQTNEATLMIAVGHPVASLGVTPYRTEVTDEVLSAAQHGVSFGAVTAAVAGIDCVVVDAGSSIGDLVTTDAMTHERVRELIELGDSHAEQCGSGVLVLGEVGVGNTTVAAALAAVLLGRPVEEMIGLGSGADSDMVRTKRDVANRAVDRYTHEATDPLDVVSLLAAIGGPEFAVLCGAVIGGSRRGGVIVLDGFATGVAALAACALEPSVSGRLIAGQRSNEVAHGVLLTHLGLEPLLDLRLRAGEGIGGVLATRMILDALEARRRVARTTTT